MRILYFFGLYPGPMSVGQISSPRAWVNRVFFANPIQNAYIEYNS